MENNKQRQREFGTLVAAIFDWYCNHLQHMDGRQRPHHTQPIIGPVFTFILYSIVIHFMHFGRRWTPTALRFDNQQMTDAI